MRAATSQLHSMGTSRRRLEELLRLDAATLERANRSKFDEIAGKSDGLVLFGAGILGRDTLERLRKIGIMPAAFSDNNPSRWGETIDDVPILPPKEALARFGNRAAFVVTIYNGSAVRQQLEDLDCRFVIPCPFLYWKYPEAFLPYFGLDRPMHVIAERQQVLEAYDLLSDDASRREYAAQVEWRMTLDYSVLPPALPAHEMYFPMDLFELRRDDVFIDCGAFDGDTVRAFISRSGANFSRIIAIEPDPSNLAALKRCVSSLDEEIRSKITIIGAAVADRPGKMHLSARANMLSEIDPNGECEVNAMQIDDLDCEPTYVKMDIEGFDANGINGGRNRIVDCAPIVAMAVEHKISDLWRLPVLLKSIRNDYSFFMKRYSEEFMEIACYAVPKSRLIVNSN